MIEPTDSGPAPQNAPRSGASRLTRPAVLGAAAAGLALVALVALVAGPALSLGSPTPSPTPRPTAAPPTATPTPESTYGPMVAVPTLPSLPPTPQPPSKLSGYVWPLDKPFITQPFGPSPWGEMIVNGKYFHDGLDIATACWDKVRAAHDGVVLTAGREYVDYMGWQGDLTAFKKLSSPATWKQTMPLIVVVDDENGYRSIYAHMYQLTVSAGQRVRAGEVIGYEGSTGRSTGCHLHYGLYSPTERELWEPLPDAVTEFKLPALIIKRIDPLLVLPFRKDIPGLASLLPSGRAPSPSPTAQPTAKP